MPRSKPRYRLTISSYEISMLNDRSIARIESTADKDVSVGAADEPSRPDVICGPPDDPRRCVLKVSLIDGYV
jgi:hypothetical protein